MKTERVHTTYYKVRQDEIRMIINLQFHISSENNKSILIFTNLNSFGVLRTKVSII